MEGSQARVTGYRQRGISTFQLSKVSQFNPCAQCGCRFPGTHIVQTALDLSGGSHLPRRSVPVDLVENLHRFGASARVRSGSTIDDAHACHRL